MWVKELSFERNFNQNVSLLAGNYVNKIKVWNLNPTRKLETPKLKLI
jgi:hypothetical protein